MTKTFVLLFIMMFSLAPGVSLACEEVPLIASAAYATSFRPAAPSTAFAGADSIMEFVHVAGGCYCMGAADDAAARDATPVHQVCVDDYSMGKYEVTQAQWREIMGNNPSTLSRCGDNCPVVDVSWNEVQEFIRLLSERTGKTYRLPTEAEWEYAVRIGGPQDMSAARDAASVGKRELRPVGWSQPNSLGIYDMLGSVWEWTGDRYVFDYYANSPMYNPEGPSSGRYRVLRGGSWDDAPQSINPSMRARYEPSIKRSWVGFRLVSPDQNSAKYRISEVPAMSGNAGREKQCRLAQQALIH